MTLLSKMTAPLVRFALLACRFEFCAVNSLASTAHSLLRLLALAERLLLRAADSIGADWRCTERAPHRTVHWTQNQAEARRHSGAACSLACSLFVALSPAGITERCISVHLP